MAGPETYSVQTRQRGAAPQLPSLAPVRSAGPTTRPATTAQQGSVSYVGAQVAEETAASQYNRAQDDATAQWLLKAATAVVEPHMKALQANQVMKGIQEAAAGKSIDEIRDAPKWYSNIFGDSDLVTAARAYQAQTAVSNFVTATQREIPNMTNMNPEEARNYMTQKWQEFQTGDMVTDAVANQQFLNAAPGLFEQYQKQNYKNWQENAKSSQQQAYSAISSSYNQKAMSAVTDGTVSQDDVLKSQAELINGLAPVDGQTFESWGSNLVTTIQDAANNGNFHSVQAIMKSGLTAKLPPDQQAQLTNFVRAQESRSILDARITPEYASQIADIQYSLRTGALSGQDAYKAAQVLNTAASAQFGYSMPMIGPDEVESWGNLSVGMLSNETNKARTDAIAEGKRIAMRQRDEAAKADADRREMELGTKRFSAGGLLPAGEDSEPTKKAGAQTFDRMEAVNPGSGYTSLVNLYGSNNGLVIPTLQARFQTGLQTADKMEWTPEFDANTTKPFMEMIKQKGGDLAAIKYFGADNVKKMNNYLASMNNGLPQPLAYHEAFVQPRRLGKVDQLNKTDREALQSQLSPAWYSSFFRDNMSPAAQQAVLQSASGHLADLKENSRYTDDAERVKTAVDLALHDGNLAVYGKWAWDRDRTAKPLHEQASLSSDQLYGVLGGVMEDMKQFKGLNYDNASFIERTDDQGRSDLMAYVPDGAGGYRVGIISLNDIKGHARAIRDAERAEINETQNNLNKGVLPLGVGQRFAPPSSGGAFPLK